MIISTVHFILFVVAWILAQIILDIFKGIIAHRQHLKLVDDVYLKVSKLLLSSMRDLKEISKNAKLY